MELDRAANDLGRKTMALERERLYPSTLPVKRRSGYGSYRDNAYRGPFPEL